MSESDSGGEPAWTPGGSAPTNRCARCGTPVSQSFFRVWNVDGILNGCPECVPRSVRFGEDVYGRDVEDFEVNDFDKDRHNEKKPPGGVQREGGPRG